LLLVGPAAFGQSATGVKHPLPATVESTSPDRGQLDGVNYTNNFFGLSLSIPPTWVVVSAQRSQTVAEQTSKLVSGEKKKEVLDASILRSVNLLSLRKLPPGEPDNASLMLIAERIPHSSIKTGVDVIQSIERAFKETNFNLEFVGETKTERIGGADFGVATVKNTSQTGIFMQKFYVTTKNGYALELFYTYQNDADLAALATLVGTMKLK
jgi:hypothetical protein